MHLHTFRDESRSRHFDLIGGRGHPWSIDLVTVTSSGILVMGFAIAIAHSGSLADGHRRDPRHRASRGRAQKFDHENRKTPISKPAENAQRPNVQADTRRARLRRSASCGIS